MRFTSSFHGLMICGSTVFYAWWKVEYVWLPYLLMAIAYLGVLWIARAKEEPVRKRACRHRLFNRLVSSSNRLAWRLA